MCPRCPKRPGYQCEFCGLGPTLREMTRRMLKDGRIATDESGEVPLASVMEGPLFGTVTIGYRAYRVRVQLGAGVTSVVPMHGKTLPRCAIGSAVKLTQDIGGSNVMLVQRSRASRLTLRHPRKRRGK